MTEEELNKFRSLKDIEVVFDVGVRDSIDYLDIKPEANFHLFEPNIIFFSQLVAKISQIPPIKGEVHINNFGLGNVEKNSAYNVYLQAFMDGAARPGWGGDLNLPIKTLDNYIAEKNITRIDFLKIDTEGYDLKVLEGGRKALEMVRYLQFETWDNIDDFKMFLGNKWEYEDIGNRNIFCTRR